MSTNRIVTYSLLAHINDNNEGIKDLTDIYVPLVMRILAQLGTENKMGTNLSDIKERFFNEYGMNIPVPLLKKLLFKIAHFINKEDTKFLTVHTDGSVLIKKYAFDDYKEQLLDQISEIERLKEAYEDYLTGLGIDIEKQPSIFTFLDTHRLELAQYFDDCTQRVKIEEPKLLTQVKFIEYIKTKRDLYKILRKVYLGSIIGCYLECDNFGHPGTKIEFMFDTTFIISLIGLHTPEDKETCLKVIEICGKIGHKAVIMDYTLEETENLINTRAEDVDNIGLEDIGTDSIFLQCVFNNYKKTDLQMMATNLESKIREIFKSKNCELRILNIEEQYKQTVKKGAIYAAIKDRPNNQGGALHDAIAIDYIRNERKKRNLLRKKNVTDAQYWFVTDDKYTVTLIDHSDNVQSECITANHLVQILWLSSPSANSSIIQDIGLTKLISNTINNAISKSRVFKDLHENFEKYKSSGVSDENLMRIAYGVASNSLSLNDIAEINSEANNGNFASALHEKIEKVRVIEEEEKRKRELLEQQKAATESEYKQKLEETKALYEKKIEREKKKNSILQFSNNIRIRIMVIDGKIKDETIDLNRKRDKQREISKSIKLFMKITSILTILALLYPFYKLCVQIMSNWGFYEPLLSILALIFPIFLLVLYIIFGRELHIKEAYDNIVEWLCEKQYEKNGVSNDKITELENKLNLYEKEKEAYRKLNQEILEVSENMDISLEEFLQKNIEYSRIGEALKRVAAVSE